MSSYAVSPKGKYDTIYASFNTIAEAIDYAEFLAGPDAADRLTVWEVAA